MVRFLASPRRRRFAASRRPCVSYPVPPCLVVPRPDRRFACFSHFGLVRLSVRSAAFRPSPRLTCRRTGRLAVPVFPFFSGGSLFGVPFLGVARSSGVIVSPRVRPLHVVLACFPASVSCGGGCCDCRWGRASCVLLAFPLRLVRWRRGCLVPACCLPSICVSPRSSVSSWRGDRCRIGGGAACLLTPCVRLWR